MKPVELEPQTPSDSSEQIEATQHDMIPDPPPSQGDWSPDEYGEIIIDNNCYEN